MGFPGFQGQLLIISVVGNPFDPLSNMVVPSPLHSATWLPLLQPLRPLLQYYGYAPMINPLAWGAILWAVQGGETQCGILSTAYLVVVFSQLCLVQAICSRRTALVCWGNYSHSLHATMRGQVLREQRLLGGWPDLLLFLVGVFPGVTVATACRILWKISG